MTIYGLPRSHTFARNSFLLHGQKITDEYNWLRDSEWPNVSDKKIIEYLQAENKYSEQFFEPLQKEKDKIFEELKGRIKLADQSTLICSPELLLVG
jgi:oligopeptidase B